MLHLSQFPELDQKIAFADKFGRGGGSENMEQYRKSIKKFAQESNFKAFWKSRISFYNRILDLTIANLNVMKIDFITIMEGYFNETRNGYNVMITPAFGNYGPQVTNADSNSMIYACIQTTNMKDDLLEMQ